jgi:predicted nucleic acid-binding protein
VNHLVIVDTTVWVDYIRGQQNAETDWMHAEFGRRRISLTDLILCEILQGIQDDSELQRVRQEIFLFEVLETGGITLAMNAAQNYRTLRSHGHTVRKTIDCLIATFCILNGHSLLHRDRDFGPFEKLLGLSVVHPELPSE